MHLHHGYWAVFLGIFFESFGLPLPGETLLITSSIIASQGKLHIGLVAALAVVGAIIGDNIGFVIGRSGGRRFVERFGRFFFLGEKRFAALELFFKKNSSKVIVTARFFDGLRQFNGILAGICGVSFRRFLICNTIGAVLWVGFWSATAYFFGVRLGKVVFDFIRYDGWVVASVLAVILTVLVVRRRMARRGQRAESKASAPVKSKEGA
ncbi:MAG: DedA family protein [Candidatus Omnitrophota bacterium]